jgi:hypothetical protein
LTEFFSHFACLHHVVAPLSFHESGYSGIVLIVMS